VIFLDRQSVVVADHGVRILGCTLWSAVPEDLQMKALLGMNDARQILETGEIPLTPRAMTELHRQEKEWLRHEIESSSEPCVVLTHYMPSFSLIHEKYAGMALNVCFASDSEDLFQPPVVAWICGHTHTGAQTEIRGIPCVLNPHGYPTEDVETRNRTAVIKV
jgi:hypothetical protein